MRRICALELSNGTTIEVTPEHRFFSNGEWTPIEELNVNDTLQLKDNSIVVIENKIIFPTFVEVYNLELRTMKTIMSQKRECWCIMGANLGNLLTVIKISTTPKLL